MFVSEPPSRAVDIAHRGLGHGCGACAVGGHQHSPLHSASKRVQGDCEEHGDCWGVAAFHGRGGSVVPSWLWQGGNKCYWWLIHRHCYVYTILGLGEFFFCPHSLVEKRRNKVTSYPNSTVMHHCQHQWTYSQWRWGQKVSFIGFHFNSQLLKMHPSSLVASLSRFVPISCTLSMDVILFSGSGWSYYIHLCLE